MSREIKVTFRLNEEEWRQLKADVRRTGLSQEAYLRLLISSQRPKELPPIEYHELLRQLHAIGVNMNQIAARANRTGFFLAEEYDENTKALRKAVLEIQTAFTLPESG